MSKMPEGIEDKIFDFIYREAMGDAIQRSKVKRGSKKRFLTFNPEALNDAEIARNKVRNYIDDIVRGDNPDFYFTASQVVHALSRIDSNFNFGNAQKLINITAKYFYIRNYHSKNKGDRDNFSCCHCPMDSNMKDIVVRAFKNYLKKSECTDDERKLIIIKIGECETTNWEKVNWTELDESNIDIYEKYQIMVKIRAREKGLIPIEYDYVNWDPDSNAT